MNEDILSDDLMPTDGGLVGQQPEDVVEEVNAEQTMITSSAAVMDDLFAWFDESIAETADVSNIDVTQSTDLVVAQVLAQRIVKEMLQAQKERLRQLDELYNKRR